MSETVIQHANPYDIFRRQSANNQTDYAAASTHYTENFSRDGLTAGIVGGSPELLASQLQVSAEHQGVKSDPQTGERPGRIHHQMPGVQWGGRPGLTTYDACDTTPLFLIGAEGLRRMDQPAYRSFMHDHADQVVAAVDHITTMTGPDSLYWEEPPAGAAGFNIRVTMWKDSVLPRRDGKEEPHYPVTYAQAHFMAARALLSAGRLLHHRELTKQSGRMMQAGIGTFMRTEGFVVYQDADGELQQDSSDEMHALAYIPPAYTPVLPLRALQRRAANLATPFGFTCSPADVSEHLQDDYHGDTVWIIDQALIHYGATKFGLKKIANIAATVRPYIMGGQEHLGITRHANGDLTAYPRGLTEMLWSRAAAEYFAGNSILSHDNWL